MTRILTSSKLLTFLIHRILVLKSEKALKRGKITLQELFEVNEKAFKLKAGIMADDIQKKINLRDLKKTLILQNVS